MEAYSSGYLVLSHLGLAFVLVLRPFFPELVVSTDLLSFEHPPVLLFCFVVSFAPITSEECHAWFHLHELCWVARIAIGEKISNGKHILYIPWLESPFTRRVNYLTSDKLCLNILNFNLFACFPSFQLGRALANEIKHDHSPVLIVVLDPRYDLS